MRCEDGMFCACSNHVPNDVPEVLNAFLKGVPNSTSFYPISFAQSCPTVIFGGSLPSFKFFWNKWRIAMEQ